MDNKEVINHEFDYSNVLPDAKAISVLVNYCDNVYKQFVSLVESDEEKNKPFKPEYKDYMYKKVFSQGFEVIIWDKAFSHNSCNDINSFSLAVQNGSLNNISSLEIKMNIDFARGKGESLDTNENSFVISFKPYEIKFKRKSNHNDPEMNQIEESINAIMRQLPVSNTIFCTK